PPAHGHGTAHARPRAAAASESPSAHRASGVFRALLVSVVTLLAVVSLASVGLRYAASRRASATRREAEPSVSISAVYVDARWLPIVDGVARARRRAARATMLAPILVGFALVLVVAVLFI